MNKKALSVALLSLCMLVTTGCGKQEANSSSEATPSSEKSEESSSESVAVKELVLTLSKQTARVGDTVDAQVTVKPSNASNKEYTLSSSDTTVAKIEDNRIVCLKSGVTTITARSKENATKKASATLTVLGQDEQGRYENVFEAENANLIKTEGSSMGVETVDDERVSGNSVVGKISKGDRIVWGINAEKAEENAGLTVRLMGPSGWLGMWDSINYTFADFYTLKLNGKVIDTENIEVAGTTKRLGSADYYAVQDVNIGNISLLAGLNTITFVYSNRFDQTTISNATYNGTLSCMGNIDCLKIAAKGNLSETNNATEPANSDPDVLTLKEKFEVEAADTRVYVDADTPKMDLSGKTEVELAKKMQICTGIELSTAGKARFTLKLAAPYKEAGKGSEALALSKLLKLTVNDKPIALDGVQIKAFDTASKANYVELSTPFVDMIEGKNNISFEVSDELDYAFLGALDYVQLDYFKGIVSSFLMDEPTPTETYVLEAEADTTKRVGYDSLPTGATYVELKDSYKTQTEVYNNKIETTKIIFGVKSSRHAYATLKMRMSSPYLNATSDIEEVGLGSLGDLWLNGTLVSTPEKIAGTSSKGVKDNFTEVEIGTKLELEEGMNRIVWEPSNYTGKAYEFLGAMDKISLTTNAVITPYEVNMWTDRNTYMDDDNNEPIYVTVDKNAPGYDASHCWVGLYKKADTVEENQPGSLYWYYPSVSSYNSDGVDYFGKPCDITKQHPNSERPLITGETGGYYKVVYMTIDSANAKKGYDVYDTVYISCWNDPDQYGGRIS